MLTDTKIKSLKSRENRYQVADSGGLILEIRPTGGKTWLYRYRVNGKPEKLTIGSYPEITLAEARNLHQEARRKVERGESPCAEKQQAQEEARLGSTVADFTELWFADYGAQSSLNWRKSVRNWLDKDVIPGLGKLKIADVTPRDILGLLDNIKARGATVSALRVRIILKQIFDAAKGRQAILNNPVNEIPSKIVGKLKSRERTLSPAELRTFFSELKEVATGLERNKIALKIIAHTLCRKMELGRARWEDINFETSTWNIPPANSKNGKPHIVYLSHQVKAMFKQLQEHAGDSLWCLPSQNDEKKHLGTATLNFIMGTMKADYTIHDLRRTGATLLNEAGYPAEVIEKALNHTLRGVRGIYNRAEYADQRRGMLQFWSDYLEQLTTKDNVVIAPFGKVAA